MPAKHHFGEAVPTARLDRREKAMVIVSVMYGPDDEFDETYYLTRHMPMVRARWEGLMTEGRVLKGVQSDGGDKPAYPYIAELSFPSMAEAGSAMKGLHAAEIMGDVANFTRQQPTMLTSEVIS